MKAIICEKHGLPDSLVYKEIPSLIVQDNDVLIQVAACSVNFPDTLIIQDKYQFKPELPFSPGGEVSGVVLEVGSNVKHLEVGQQVFALCGWGGFAEEVLVDKSKVFPMVKGMDFVTAASIMYNYGTSYHALKNRAELQAGQTLLVLGAGGGVGLAAVQLGKLMGATVIAAASSTEKLDVCQKNGADYCINYETQDLKEQIKQITQSKGVDVVYDSVGDRFTEPALRAIAWGGKYLVVGFAAGEIPKIGLNLALLKGCSIIGVFWGQFAAKQPFDNLQNLKELADFFEKGQIKAHIYKEYPLENAAEALNDLINRKVIGKAVVICNQELCDGSVLKSKKENEVLHNLEEKPEIKTTKTIFTSFDQVIAAVGQELGQSEWLEIDQEMINKFADATLDKQWIHVNPEKAKNTPFGQTIAHGLLTLSLSPKFLEETYEVKNTKMGINYGSDKVRFLKPVLSGSKLKMVSKLISASEVANNGLKMIVEASYYVEGQAKPVCVAELISVLYC